MTCASCGVRNVDFASTCFSCRQPLGKLSAVAAPATPREALEARKSAPPGMTRRGADAPSVPRGAIMTLLLVAAVAWVVARGLPVRMRSVSPHSADAPAEPAKEVRSLPLTEPAPREPTAPLPEEQNGFRLSHFEWGVPAAGRGSTFRTGETVSGRSEIQGFGVTADGKIDVTVALAFRDPTGKLVEPISPTVLRQPMESETLFTSFDYAIPADGPTGKYDLEMAIDDAVGTRSAHFHRKITVEAAKPQ